jgi:hypothetical protein
MHIVAYVKLIIVACNGAIWVVPRVSHVWVLTRPLTSTLIRTGTPLIIIKRRLHAWVNASMMQHNALFQNTYTITTACS